MDREHEYVTDRGDLAQALAELNEAGYDVHCRSAADAGSSGGGDVPEPGFAVRIVRGVEQFDGRGPSQDAAFEAALEKFEHEGRPR
jgi:hypothetical protein